MMCGWYKYWENKVVLQMPGNNAFLPTHDMVRGLLPPEEEEMYTKLSLRQQA